MSNWALLVPPILHLKMNNELWQLLKVKFPGDRNDFIFKPPKGNDRVVPAMVGTWFGAWGSTEHIKSSFFGARQEKVGRRERTNREICLKHMGKCEKSCDLQEIHQQNSHYYTCSRLQPYFLGQRQTTKNWKSLISGTIKEAASSMELAYLKEESNNRREFVTLENKGWNVEGKNWQHLSGLWRQGGFYHSALTKPC